MTLKQSFAIYKKNLVLQREAIFIHVRYSAFHTTFDRRFAKFVVNFISSLRTWEFQYVTVNQTANFETNLGISSRTSWECGEVISPLLSVVVLK